MKIKSLYLENFKSYKEETINFEEGINCILGNNGAGKSSIIEAIGFAMFNYTSKSNRNKYIRYGESKAKVELVYVANDGVEYKITRSIGGNDIPKLLNLNTLDLIENVGDVYPQIAKTLGINQERKLSNLFQEIIAVPQGEFVSLFLSPDAKRKKDFDELFNLKVYQDMFGKTAEVIKKNEETKYNVEKDIAVLKSETSDLAELKEETKKDENQYNNTIKINNDLKARNNQLKTDLEQQKEIVKKIGEAKENIQNYDLKIESEKTELKVFLEESTKIDEAIKIINENEKAYNQYIEFNRKINDEGIKAEVYHNEKENYAKISGEILKENGELTHIEKEINTLEFNIGGFDKTLDEINNSKKALNDKKEIAINERNVKTNAVETTKKEIEDLNKKIADLDAKLFNYQMEYKEIEKLVNIDLNEENKQLEKYNRDKATKAELNDQIEAKKEEITKARITIKNIKDNMDSLSKGMCPIFNNDCGNLNQKNNGTLLNLLANESNKIDKLNEEYDGLKSKLEAYSELEINIKETVDNIDKRKEYDSRVNNIIISINNEIIDFKTENKNINQILDELSQIINKEKVTIILKNKEQELNINEEKDAIDNVNKIDSELMVLGLKENTTKQEKNDSENRLKEQKESLEKQNKKIKELQEDLKESNKIIKENESSINLIEEYKKQLKLVKEGYEIYLKNYDKSTTKNINEESIKNTNENIKEYNSVIEENKLIISELAKKYNEETYQKNNAEYNQNIATIDANEKLIISLKETIDKKQNKINDKEKKINEIGVKEKLINKYEKVSKFLENSRTILRNLPIELSRQYRENISKLATIYYQKISRENVSINIDETYNVIVIDNSKKDNIKEMSQLSGGEQMSLAISIRISMLKYFVGVDMYFLDEPTVNLDKDRRFEIADLIKDYSKELKQLFVISHDDTFESITTNIIKLEKNNNKSEIETN